MTKQNSRRTVTLAAGTALAMLLAVAILPRRAGAYVEVPHTFGRIVSESTTICVMRVEKVDKERNLIIYSKVQDLKGKHPQDTIKHNVGRAGFHEREWKTVMAWAEPGKIAVFFHNGSASETYIDGYWYQCYPGGEWWNHSHGEPYLLRSYAGKPEKLATIVPQMLAGQEVIVPAMRDGDKNALQLRTAKMQRMRASLKILDYNQDRDFAGWGGDEFRALAGMPGFAMYGGLTRFDRHAAGIATADIDGDGLTDVCLVSEERVALFKSGAKSAEEVSLPYSGGARAASFADWNGDKRPDLLLATPTGPRLLTNVNGASFKDDSAALPKEPYYNLTAAAFIDADGDAKPDVLLANGFLGLRLYRNRGAAAAAAAGADAKAPATAFEDVSDRVGLGLAGIGATAKGDRLLVADVNGDGRADFLYCAAPAPLLVLGTPNGFAEARDHGLTFTSGRITPALADFDGDKAPDLFVPHPAGSRLFRNDGKGKFTDVTARAGDLAKPVPHAVGAAFADLAGSGKPGLLVACARGANRFFRNNGDGTFADATESLGFHQKAFGSRALAVADLNKDGALDLVLCNEAAESAVLLAAPRK